VRLTSGGARFIGAHLQGAELFGADLEHANLSGADFQGANLSEAYLRHTILHWTNLEAAIGLTQEQLDLASVYEGTKPPAGLTVHVRKPSLSDAAPR
jgi:uncharacterized protein YjbI with pentapeptide repeats